MAGSAVQSASNQLCACGVSVGPAGAIHWGGGIYIDLSQPDEAGAGLGAVAPLKTGIQYAIGTAGGALPGVTRLEICTVPQTSTGGCPATDHYCYDLTALSGYIPWSDFNTTCWNPTKGTYLPTAPAAVSQIQLQIAPDATGTPIPWDMCVTSLSF